MLFGVGLVGFIVTVIVICAVYYLLTLLIKSAPFIPDGIKVIVTWIILAVCILWFIDLLVGLTGHPIGLGNWRS